MSTKLGGKSFKFASSQYPYKKAPPALSRDKKTTEFVLSMIFSQILIFNGIKITNIEVNENDNNHRPDTFINADGVKTGIQITKLSLNDPLRRINIAENQTNELLNMFSNDIKLERPINVYIYLNSIDKNNIPKGNFKKKKRLVQFITDKILENKDKIFGSEPDSVYLPIEDEFLKTLATSITLNPIIEGQHSTFIGRNGIHINYEFDIHQWDENDLNEEIQRIIIAKEEGSEDVLLIWGDRFEMLYQDKQITEVLKEKFSKTKFKEVFFLSLFDRVELFWNSWRLNKIK